MISQPAILTFFCVVLKPHAAKLRKSKMLPGFEGFSPWSCVWIGAVLLGAGSCTDASAWGFPLVAMPCSRPRCRPRAESVHPAADAPWLRRFL
jgi:hypothetical protein